LKCPFDLLHGFAFVIPDESRVPLSDGGVQPALSPFAVGLEKDDRPVAEMNEAGQVQHAICQTPV
jgi:hypothetical protein